MPDEYPPTVVRDKVGKLKVVKDEVLASGLSAHVGKVVPIHTVRVLTLSDDSVVHGCRDCLFTGTLGEVKAHRNAEHGGKVGRNAAGPQVTAETLGMSLGELLELAGNIEQWEGLFEKVTRQRDEALEDAAELRRQLAAEKRAHASLKSKLGKLVGD